MTIHDRKGIKQTAASRLSEAAFDPRILILIHTGVSMGVTLLITAINYILQQQIGGTGGLSGIGLRSILATAQSALQLAGMLALPFWEIGILYAFLKIARRQSAAPSDLTMGFRRFGPVLRLNLLRSAVFFAIMMFCVNIGSGIFMITPLSKPLLEILLPLLESAADTNATSLSIDDATLTALVHSLAPMIPILLVLFLLLAAPLYYRLRMADYLIMEGKKTGALAALITSWRLTKGRAFGLFRLDLSFWWFYALQVLTLFVCYFDLLAPALGISLPFSAEISSLVFYVLYAALTMLLYRQFGSYLHTAYAVAYDTLRYQAAMPSPIIQDNEAE